MNVLFINCKIVSATNKKGSISLGDAAVEFFVPEEL